MAGNPLCELLRVPRWHRGAMRPLRWVSVFKREVARSNPLRFFSKTFTTLVCCHWV